MDASSPTPVSGRSWVAVQFLLMSAVLLAAAWPGLRWSASGSLWAGIPLFVLGAWIGLKGKADLGRNRITRPEPRPDGALVTGGIYAFIRHPLYASLILLGFAWALIWRSWPVLGLALVQAIFLDAKARCEERYLKERFDGYAAYRRRVKRLIPGLY
jgi:protein-S-isoprenylcysteine O-methyltransferase Ste14